jgi:hypothetical protein
MNIIGIIRTSVQNGETVPQIKTKIQTLNPNYNLYWVEDEWLRFQVTNKHASIEDIKAVIKIYSSFFHRSWLNKKNKLQKFYDSCLGISIPVTGTAVRQAATYNTLDEQRTYGVEFEFARPMRLTWDDIIEALDRPGIRAKVADRLDYTDITVWRLCTDGSVDVPINMMDTHAGQNELKSPILRGQAGLESIKKVLKVLKSLGCNVNGSCGLHVHHGFKSKDDAENARIIHNCCILYQKYKNKIAKILPEDRRHNLFSRSFRRKEVEVLTTNYGKPFEDKKIPPLHDGSFPRSLNSRNRQASIWGKKYAYGLNFCNDRRRAVNIEAYFTHGTLEFRQHSGTLDETKTINWILLTQAFMNTAEDYFQRKINLMAHKYSPIQQELKLNADLRNYIRQRAEAMKNGKETEYVGECLTTTHRPRHPGTYNRFRNVFNRHR